MSIELKAMPFDSKEILNEVTGETSFDRVSYSKDLADWMRTYFSNGILVQGGDTLGEELKVIHKEGLTVAIKPGAVCINGRTGWNDVEQTLTVNIGGEEPRIDMIVAELNIPNDRGIYIKLIEGISAASPQKPTLIQNEDVYQIPLASLRIEAGSARVGSVVDERQGNISNVTIGIKPPTGNDAVAVKVSDKIKTKFKLSDNANVEDALAVVSDEEYILNCYDTSGEIMLPSDAVHNEVDVVCVAGGGGGWGGARKGVQSYEYEMVAGRGGDGGFVIKQRIIVGTEKKASIVIGAGGKGSNATDRRTYSSKGGETRFRYDDKLEIVVYGGGTERKTSANTNAEVGVVIFGSAKYKHSGLGEYRELIGFGAIAASGGYKAQSDLFKNGVLLSPISLPTKDIITSGGGVGRTSLGKGTGNGMGGEGGDEGKKGANAIEYGCGGGGGGCYESGTQPIGGDGRQGCVYIGYWRKRG